MARLLSMAILVFVLWFQVTSAKELSNQELQIVGDTAFDWFRKHSPFPRELKRLKRAHRPLNWDSCRKRILYDLRHHNYWAANRKRPLCFDPRLIVRRIQDPLASVFTKSGDVVLQANAHEEATTGLLALQSIDTRAPLVQVGFDIKHDTIVGVRFENEPDFHSIDSAYFLAMAVQGVPGRTVVVRTQSKSGHYRDRTIVRGKLHPISESVEVYEELRDATGQFVVGHIGVNTFSPRTASAVHAAMQAVPVSADGLRYAVVVLRFNQGGLLAEVLKTASLFAPRPTETLLVWDNAAGVEQVITAHNPLGIPGCGSVVTANTKRCLLVSPDGSLLQPGMLSKERSFRIAFVVNHKTDSGSVLLTQLVKQWEYPVVGTMTATAGPVKHWIPLSHGFQLRMITQFYRVGDAQVSLLFLGVTPTINVADQRPGLMSRDTQLERAVSVITKGRFR